MLSRDKKDLDSAIAYQEAVVDLCPHDGRGRAPPMSDLAFLLGARYERWGDASDLERAIAMNRNALDLRPDGHPERSMSMNNTANCLLTRYKREGNLEDLDEAIALHRAALDLHPDGHPERSTSLNNVAECLSTRYKREGKLGDLEEAIALHRIALDLRPDGHIERSASLNNTAGCLFMRYEREGKREDLEEAIALSRASLNLHPDGRPDRSTSLNNTANCLVARYKREGKLKDLEEAIALHRMVLDLRPDGHPDRSTSLNNTAGCLFTRFEREGKPEDLDEAIAMYRAALDLHPDGHPNRSTYLSNTANCLLRRYEHKGKPDDLEEAIALYRTALDLRPNGHPARSMSLSNTANCLFVRFRLEGKVEDLEEAISLHRIALGLRPDGHPERSTSLNNVAGCLFKRYERGGKLGDLEEAIALHRAALDLRPDGHPGRSMSLSNTAICLLTEYTLEGRLEDLEEAIALHRVALDLRPNGHPDRSMSLNNTAGCLLVRYEREGKLEDLEEAIALCHASLDLRPDGHPDRSTSLYNTANCLLFHYRREGKPEDLEEAIQFLSRSATHTFSGFAIRFQAVRRWAETARSYKHESLAEAYKTALSVLQRARITRPNLSAQHKFLTDDSDFQTLAMDAASSAIDKGALHQAVEFLEQGRALLWSQMRGFRTPLDRLTQVNPSLAERFEVCNRRLETLISDSGSGTGPGFGVDNDRLFNLTGENRAKEQVLVQLRRLYEEQEAIISDIRRIPEFECFLQVTPFETLKQVSSEGPVVVLNHSRYRCDALILVPRENDPCICVPLDDDFYGDSVKLYDELLKIRREFKVYSREYDDILRELMKFLWDRVVFKVVVKLKELGVAEGSRIWWCPTSVLTAFPFHAAGPHMGADGSMKYLLDDYISSYTPTLASLISSRLGHSDGKGRMLFVADTTLSSAIRERHAIHRVRRINRQLLDEDATPDSVLRELQRLPWVHFVCHGILDEEPFNSRLKISGGGLKLLDIARANLPNAEFAFLSACHTAEQGPRYALDEVLHLAAAMQFCGFRSVVGTMWQLLDRDGPFLSQDVYTHLKHCSTQGGARHKNAAAAVRAAARKLRGRVRQEVIGDEANAMTERWVNLVHIGA